MRKKVLDPHIQKTNTRSSHRRKTHKKVKIKIDYQILLPYISAILTFLLFLLAINTLIQVKITMSALEQFSGYYSGFSNYMLYAERIWDTWEQYYGKKMSRFDRALVLRTVYDQAMRYNIDPILVLSIIFVESKGNPNAVSIAGAKGLMQLMPGTYKYFAKGLKGIKDPTTNIIVGTSYLRDLIRNYRDLDAILIHYNGGAKAFKYMPKETRLYVQRVKLTYKVFSSGNFMLVREFVRNTAEGKWE